MTHDTFASLLRRAAAPDPRDGATQRHHARRTAGWRYISFSQPPAGPGQGIERAPDDQEVALVIVEGAATVDVGWPALRLAGQPDDGLRRSAAPGGAGRARPGRHGRARNRTPPSWSRPPRPARASRPGSSTTATIRVEQRGHGNTARTVHHLLPADEPAARLLLVEVFTPGGNWSATRPTSTTRRTRPVRPAWRSSTGTASRSRPRAFAFARVYTADRELDQALTPMDGDVVLVPRGYHPVGMPAGYDGYYLERDGRPGRAWNFTLDPDHAWLMDWNPTAPR